MVKSENTKVEKAVSRLNKILPLVERQQKLSPEINRLYKNILNSYVELGRTLNKAEITQQVSHVGEAIDILRNNDMVVFNSNDEPVGAYPFTMEVRDHKVIVNGYLVHAMCALDALAISSMFNVKTHIDSVCPVSGRKIFINQSGKIILNKEKNRTLHFGINWNSAANNCCATSLCTEMIFLKDESIADKWLLDDSKNREIFSIDEAIDFASDFFNPLIN